jgi:hypothetical protein
MGNLRVSNDVVFVKIETTYGTDSVPVAGTNAVFTMAAPQFAPEGLRMNERPGVRASLGELQRIYGGSLAKISFPVELKGSGTAGTAPEIGSLLRACAMGETVVAVTSVTYRPISSSHESVTIYWFEGGRKRHILTGCRGTATLRVSAGGVPFIDFELIGHVSDPSDQTQPTPTINATVPRAALSMAITVGGVSVVVRDWSVALNNTIALPPSVAAADGYSEIQVTGRKVGGEITLEAELASVINVDTQLSGGTGSAFASGQLGSVAGNRVNITSAAGGLVWTDRQFGEGDGLRLRTMPFQLVETSAQNDELAIAFT